MKKITFSFKKLIGIALMWCIPLLAFGQAINTKKNYIRVDQFGYFEEATKIAVIAKAVNGFNSGAGINLDINVNVKLKNANNNNTVFQAKATVWNGGNTHGLSGDRGWWFDFSSYETPGDYYIQVTETGGNTVNSNTFEISNNVYDDVLRAAVEMFYYQRVSIDKTAAYGSGADWTDTSWYTKANQDNNAKYLYSSERRNVSKGWIDAGDPNKYITFALEPVHNLLTTYEQHPGFWDDFTLRIPENNNDLPDILDEIKWEIDWIKNMHRNDGSVHSKAGIKEDFNYISPPSTDTRERYYAQTCPVASVAAAGMMAHAALALDDFPSQSSYVSDLITRAEKSWDYYSNSPDKDAVCDNGEIEAGDADGSGNHYLVENVAEAVCAAVYLYAVTGKSKYNDFVKNNYAQARAFVSGDWGIYRSNQSEAILFYTTLPNADNATKTAILNKKTGKNTESPGLHTISDNADFYRINPFYLNWGSNSLIARQGSDTYDFINYNLETSQHSNYQKTTDGILHYFHGVNPLGLCYLTNMYSYGAELCVDQLWHTWFFVDDKYDGAPDPSQGIVGPAPGFMTGGANPQANGSTVITLNGVRYGSATLGNQPSLKAFADENKYINVENQSPFALVEPAIYYQSGYIKFLANYVATVGGGSNPPGNNDSGEFEIENVFQVVNEAGSNNTVGPDTYNPNASAGVHVRLFDTNDELSFPFTVNQSGDYKIDIRLRVGEASGTTSNLAGQYEIKVNGNVSSFSLDNSSISALDLDTYWGNLTNTVSLSAGTHTINIRAKANWLKADKFSYALQNSVPDPEPSSPVFFIKNKQTGKYLRAENSSVGAKIQVAANDNSNIFKWEKVTTSDGYFFLKNIETGKYFRPITTSDGSLMEAQNTTANGTRTQWIEVLSPDNTNFYLKNRDSQKYIRPQNGNAVSDVELRPSSYTGDWTRWSYEPATVTPPSGDIVIRAAGDCGIEDMELRVNGQVVKSWQNVGTSFANYTYSGFTSGSISVHFTNNDNPETGCSDKNLTVDWIEVCGNRLQTETEATENSDCCQSVPDKLFTNGNFDFGSRSCNASSARSSSETTEEVLVLENEEETIADGIFMYPNPVKDGVLTISSEDRIHVTIYDLSGKPAISQENVNGEQALNVSKLNPGIYIVTVISQSTGEKHTTKILIE
ncbi:glycoside hydrolase family 9 protein [Galbibacter mesophilus]|uniref:glycoside hydrolase family 9 protein n=1 Tax=Galbibacter mesophilus TaxID=379069 RepID=UPI00191FA668|nr:glycoside hydrolase family 9 protein [Galbibacter mesophilus]MCM5661447.1 glycoside hydrolase family 9 protein [Galbibacter mesophilus]